MGGRQAGWQAGERAGRLAGRLVCQTAGRQSQGQGSAARRTRCRRPSHLQSRWPGPRSCGWRAGCCPCDGSRALRLDSCRGRRGPAPGAGPGALGAGRRRAQGWPAAPRGARRSRASPAPGLRGRGGCCVARGRWTPPLLAWGLGRTHWCLSCPGVNPACMSPCGRSRAGSCCHATRSPYLFGYIIGLCTAQSGDLAAASHADPRLSAEALAPPCLPIAAAVGPSKAHVDLWRLLGVVRGQGVPLPWSKATGLLPAQICRQPC